MTSPNSHLEPRRIVAQRVGDALETMPNIAAVYVFGSVASGHVDAMSDVDIGVVCHRDIPTVEARREALGRIGSGWRIGDTSQSNPIWQAYDLGGVVDGIGVEVHYHTQASITDVLDQVINNGAVTTKRVPFRPYTLAALIQRAWVLADLTGTFQRWREQVQVYPPILKRNILQHWVPILDDCIDELRSTAERHLGPMIFVFFLYHAMHVTSIAFALNDTYDPADRRQESTILPRLTHVPPEFTSRLKYIFEGPFDGPGAIQRALLLDQLSTELITMAKAELQKPL